MEHQNMQLIRDPISTETIHKLLSSNKFTSRTYAGTFSADLLPAYALTERQKPAIVIVNHGTSQSTGIHWTLIYFPGIKERKPAYYFDSFGLDIPNGLDSGDMSFEKSSNRRESVIKHFINRNSKFGYEYNRIQLQDPLSQGCGYFVLVVAYLLSIGLDRQKALQIFSTKPTKNDALLLAFIKKKFGFLT